MAYEEEKRAMLSFYSTKIVVKMQSFALAAENANKKRGKMSKLFGDVGAKAEQKFLDTFKNLVEALYQDGHIRQVDDKNEIFASIDALMLFFKMAYPNWPTAYNYIDGFINENFDKL
jgi:hypothetical protein